MGSIQDFFSVKAAAKEIGIEAMTLYQRIHRGKVKHERISNEITVIPKAEVLRLKEEERLKRERNS